MKIDANVDIVKIEGEDNTIIAEFTNFDNAHQWLDDNGYHYTGVDSIYQKDNTLVNVYGVSGNISQARLI